jgi:hypothetical protein
MAEYKKQVTLASVAAIVIVIAVASAVLYLPLGLGQTSETQRPSTQGSTTTESPHTTTTSGTNLTTSTIESTGPSLQASTNGTTIREGQNLAINATLFNTQSQSLLVSTTYDWPIAGLLMFSQNWPPCGYYSPLELIVLRGNFTPNELKAMGPGSTPGLGCFEHQDYVSFRFEPSSNVVYVTGSWSVTGNVSTHGPQRASITVTVNGYWDNGSSLNYPTSYVSSGDFDFLAAQHPFVKGVYTIAVADEWGQLSAIYVKVE